jgi:hypothetical protein
MPTQLFTPLVSFFNFMWGCISEILGFMPRSILLSEIFVQNPGGSTCQETEITDLTAILYHISSRYFKGKIFFDEYLGCNKAGLFFIWI